MLKHDKVALEEKLIKSGEVSIHVLVGGEGIPLILLHGWPGFWKDWEKVIPLVVGNCKVIVPDLRGFGLSDKPRRPEDYTLEHYSADVEAIMNALGLRTAFLAGFDVGSIVAAYFASRNPNRVAGLILMNPSYPGLGRKRLELPYAAENWYQLFHLTDLAEALVSYNRDTVKIYLSHFYERWSYRKSAFNERDVEEYVDVYFKHGLFGGFNWYRARFQTRYGDWLGGGVEASTLVIWSDRDPIFPLEWSGDVKKFFPNSEVVYINDCGHFIPREAPEVTAEHIQRFLSKQQRLNKSF